MECLESNKICTVKKCKICVLDDCKETFKMIDYNEKQLYEKKMNLIINQLEEQCKNCSFLEVIDLDKQVVRCAYLVKDKCLIEKTNKKS